MNRYTISCSVLLTCLLLLADAGVSQAGIFGRWRGRYDYQPCPPAASTTAQPAPAASQSTAAPAGPIAYSAAKPIVGDAAPAAPQPARTYAPSASVSTGASYSVAPRSSWDYGSFPPYSH